MKTKTATAALDAAAMDAASSAAVRRSKQRAAGVRADGPGNEQQISMFLHCGKCLREVQEKAQQEGTASPRDYARLSVGWTPIGLQVWCNRHDCNVMHVDFEGHQHPANSTAPTEGEKRTLQ